MKFDYIIVGAGLSGCVIAEQLAKSENKKILIIEKRNHIAGNCYDFRDRDNILIHKYGPHIFHTNNEEVWNYISQFTEWENYQHRVLGSIDGKLIPIPFNINSINKCFSGLIYNKIEKKLLEKYPFGAKIPILKLRKENDGLLKMLADFVYNKVFLGYTMKQWGLKPEELDESVTARVPILVSNDNRYFQDKYQGIPKFGYTKLIEKMIDKPNIHLLLNTDFFDIKNELKYDKLIFTGMLDEYFNYDYGKLPYRSLRFEFQSIVLPSINKEMRPLLSKLMLSTKDILSSSSKLRMLENQLLDGKTKLSLTTANELSYTSEKLLTLSNDLLYKLKEMQGFSNKYQQVAQVNYPNEYDFTRITEFTHFYFHHTFFNKTVIAKEYPVPYDNNEEIPYYPIPQKDNNELADKYKNLTKSLKNIIFLGRLADYSYYNMDQTIERALIVAKKRFY